MFDKREGLGPTKSDLFCERCQFQRIPDQLFNAFHGNHRRSGDAFGDEANGLALGLGDFERTDSPVPFVSSARLETPGKTSCHTVFDRTALENLVELVLAGLARVLTEPGSLP
jgi:hypothetical protein